MRSRSLRLRLLALALVSITAALVVSGVGLVHLFERHVERRVENELDTYLRQIAGSIAFGPGGEITVTRSPADPRFEQPLSGLYWQVEDDATGETIRSRSLWDTTLALPADLLDGSGVHRHMLPGPGRATVIVRERAVTYTDTAPPGQRTLRIAVAIDHAEIGAAAAAFAGDLTPSLILLGFVLLLGAWLQVRIGLWPLEAVRRGLGAVRSGARRRLPSDYPDEVMPLVQEVNDLLGTQDQAIERARARAGDLAHGLKTPLTVLGADARRLRAGGETEIAADIEMLVETMRRHVERALAQARLRRRRGAVAILAPLVERLIATIRKTPRGGALAWENDITSDARVGIDKDDLAELIGNLLENAANWARTRVRISAAGDGTSVILAVEDDGPGIPETARAAVLERGVRLEPTTVGSGIGLAIVEDIVEAYEGSLRLEDSALGGLRAVVKLPAAPGTSAME